MNTKVKREKWLLFGCFSGLFLLFFGVLAFFHILNGSSFIYNVDAPKQDYPTFLYLGKLLRHFFSTGSLRLYDFSIGLGNDVISTLNSNGIGDPLNLLSVFAVGGGALYLYEFTLILRLYLCGIGMLLFCRKHRMDVGMSVLAAVLYTFSAFSLPNGMQYYQILNAAYIFPFLLIQTEELVSHEGEKNSGVKFSLLIALQACCSFYFLYIQTILIFVYALVEYFVEQSNNRRSLWKKIVYVSKYYLTGILLSGVILFPAIGGLMHSARMEAGISGKLYLFWSAEEILLKLENMFVHKRSAMLAMALGISFLAFLAIMRCWLGRSRKERIFSILLTIAYASPLVWSMMNGFSYPNTRWAYVIYFGVSYATVLLIEHCDETIGRKRMAVATAVFICSMGYHYIVEKDKIRTAVCVLLTGFFVWTLLSAGEKRKRKLSVLALVHLLFAVILLEGPYQIGGQELYLSFMPKAEMEAVAQTVEELGTAGEWYRVDVRENANQGALLQGYQGCWGYYSIMNSNIWSFYDALKISPAMQTINYLGGVDGRQVPESLLSVKYYEKNGEIKENSYQLPQGVEYTSVIDEKDFWQMSPLDRQDIMTRGLVLENPGEISDFNEVTVKDAVTALNCETEYVNIVEENQLLISGENARIIVHIEEDLTAFDFEEGELYLYLEGMEVEAAEDGEIRIGDKALAIYNSSDIYTTGQRDHLVKIENAEQDIVLELMEDAAYHMDHLSVYWYDLEKARESLATLQQHALSSLQYMDNCLEGDIDAVGGYLFLSIPYDRAWKVYVDQEEVPTERAHIGFTAVKLSEGKHHVRIEYDPLLQKVGLLATIVGIMLMGVECLRGKKGGFLRKQS